MRMRPAHLTPDPGWEHLSAREKDVALLMIDGHMTESIASQLEISMHTVKDHRKSIFRKLKVGSLAEFFALHQRYPVVMQNRTSPLSGGIGSMG